MSTLSGFPSTNGVATLLLPPEGYNVDFENPQRQYETEMYSVAVVGNLLMLLFLAQRLYTKIFFAKGLQLDDGFLIASYIFSIATQAIMLYTFIAGNQGVHAWELPIQEYEKFRLAVYISAPVFVPCGSFAKIALLVFYLRLSPQRWFTIAIWTTVGIIAIYSPVIVFCLLFACTPVRKVYTVMEDVDGTCIALPALYIIVAILNIVTDVILFLLPLPMLYELKMPNRQKWGVMFVFGIGSITVVTSIVRASILPSLFHDLDQSWVTAPASFWVLVESNLLIICGSIPTLRCFLNHVAPKIMGGSQRNSRSNPNTPRTMALTSTPKRRNQYYARFGSDREEDELEFQTLSQMGAKKHSHSKGGSNTVVRGVGTTTIEASGPSNSNWDDRPGVEDDESEKAIMQTKTVTVKYE